MTAATQGSRAAAAAARRRALKRRRVAWNTARYAVLVSALGVFILPIYWMFVAALKPARDLADDPFGAPTGLVLGNLTEAWNVGNYGGYLGNTLIYCALTVVGVVFLSCLGGYAFGVLEFPGRNAIFSIFLVGVVVPFQAVMIPEYYLARDLHILGTYWGYVLPGIAFGLGLGMFMMRAFFRKLPTEIADAARLDGANEWRVFRHVMMPMAWPGVVTLTIFQFIFTYKSFLLPLVLVQDEGKRPVSLGITFFFGRYTSDLGMIAAGVTISSLPMVLVYVLLQRRITEGIAQGGLKG